ncbi:ionotropic receptor 93a-like isoform X2 [Panulirus ornatus]
MNGHDTNDTFARLTQVVIQVRQVQVASWCVVVVVMSQEARFLASLGEWSVKERLLLSWTRLLVVTSLAIRHLRALMTAHWTFSMMDTMFINVESPPPATALRCGVYAHLPYSGRGARVARLASWTVARGLVFISRLPLFPNKFSNFHGATVNVTGLPYPPYWVTSGEGNATRYSGVDYQLLQTLADVLNFTIQVLPSATWQQVTDQVRRRKAFVASVVHVILPDRLEMYDFTDVFDYSPLGFGMAKPRLRPAWQNLYYPLATEVWAAILATLIIVSLALVEVTRADMRTEAGRRVGAGLVILEVFGTLMGQGLSRRLPSSNSNRVLVAAWLVFALIISTAYRSKLTASLTLPQYPSRPETLRELVATVERATIESYGVSYKNFFIQSESSTFSALGRLMVTGVSVTEGLQGSLRRKQAHIGSRQYLEYIIAYRFTESDGSTRMYVGQENIIPSTSAWPIPHDAPFKAAFDRNIKAILEAGLYDQWRKDELFRTQRESRAKRRESQSLEQEQQKEGRRTEATEGEHSSRRGLTIQHMQGPFMLLLLGLTLAAVSFAGEQLTVRWSAAAARNRLLRQRESGGPTPQDNPVQVVCRRLPSPAAQGRVTGGRRDLLPSVFLS